VKNDDVEAKYRKQGLQIRKVLQATLENDERFAWFQSDQGDHWCLVELLPQVGEDVILQIHEWLGDCLADGGANPVESEALVGEYGTSKRWQQGIRADGV